MKENNHQNSKTTIGSIENSHQIYQTSSDLAVHKSNICLKQILNNFKQVEKD